MIFDHFDYIKSEAPSGDIRMDIKNLLLINGKHNTYIHVSNGRKETRLSPKPVI